MKTILLTGIKPTGTFHLGNYIGAVRPALSLSKTVDMAVFMVADLHALNSFTNAQEFSKNIAHIEDVLQKLTRNSPNAVIIRQSQIPQISELAQILSAFTPKGFLNRSHAYKAAVEENISRGKDVDYNINAGLYNYPVLMAADILIFSQLGNTLLVPVGPDQLQHLEIAKELARKVNLAIGDTFSVPQEQITQTSPVPGVDGRKMSKGYNNIIPFMGAADAVKSSVSKIVTDSTPLAEPKDPKTCIPYQILNALNPSRGEEMKQLLMQGGFGYGQAKANLISFISDEASIYLTGPSAVKDFSPQFVAEAAKQQIDFVKSKLGFQNS